MTVDRKGRPPGKPGRRPGRPRVLRRPVVRSVRLEAEHWAWLDRQPGGAGAALRRELDRLQRPQDAGSGDPAGAGGPEPGGASKAADGPSGGRGGGGADPGATGAATEAEDGYGGPSPL